MTTIRIFLASSNELETERDKFASLINQLNRIFKPRGLELELVIWEYLNSSMSKKRKQDEYNDELKKCEICLVIFWNKFGEYTEEEFRTAYQELCAGHNPQRLYVFFKEPADSTVEMSEFKESFATEYGHFYNIFENGDTLKLNFLLQLEIFKNDILDIRKLVSVENSIVNVGGISFIDLKNVSFAANNENYVDLQRQIEKQRHRLLKNPDDFEEQLELHELLKKRQDMEDNMLGLARRLSEQSVGEMTPRMIEAKRLFEQGELQAVVKILDTQDIVADIKSLKSRIDLYTTLRNQEYARINNAVNELQMRIEAHKALLEPGWTEKIENDYNILIEEARGYVAPLEFAKILFEAARFIDVYSPRISAIDYYTECIDTMRSIPLIPRPELHTYGDMLYFAGSFFTRDVYEIHYDPTEGEWMNSSNSKVHKSVMKRWDKYKKLAKEYLEDSIEIFKKINSDGRYSEDIYHSLKRLTSFENRNGNDKSSREAWIRLIEFAKTQNLPKELRILALTDYASILHFYGKNDECHHIIADCEQIVQELNPEILDPGVLSAISSVYQIKHNYPEAERFSRMALRKYQELAQEDPYGFQVHIAGCMERIATLIHWQTSKYKNNPETLHLLDDAQDIFEKLYDVTKSDVYRNNVRHIKNFKFELRVGEKMDFAEYTFKQELNHIRDYLSTHLRCGKHVYIIDIPDCPLKEIGTIIKKGQARNEYRLLVTWSIDGCSSESSFGKYRGGTKQDIYAILTNPDFYDCVCESIVKDVDKSYHMD